MCWGSLPPKRARPKVGWCFGAPSLTLASNTNITLSYQLPLVLWPCINKLAGDQKFYKSFAEATWHLRRLRARERGPRACGDPQGPSRLVKIYHYEQPSRIQGHPTLEGCGTINTRVQRSYGGWNHLQGHKVRSCNNSHVVHADSWKYPFAWNVPFVSGAVGHSWEQVMEVGGINTPIASIVVGWIFSVTLGFERINQMIIICASGSKLHTYDDKSE